MPSFEMYIWRNKIEQMRELILNYPKWILKPLFNIVVDRFKKF